MSRIGSWLSSLVGSSGSKKADEAPQMPEGAPLVTDGKISTEIDPKTAKNILAEIEGQESAGQNSETKREQAAKNLQTETSSAPYKHRFRALGPADLKASNATSSN